jgi:lipoate-protein ligase B
MDLRKRGRDVHRYLRKLEEMLILSVAQFGITAYRRQGLTGIWTEKGKLASIGVGVRRWITMHGFALNVSTELRFFELINPCGLRDCQVTSIQEFLNREVPIHKVKDEVIRQMNNVFGDG